MLENERGDKPDETQPIDQPPSGGNNLGTQPPPNRFVGTLDAIDGSGVALGWALDARDPNTAAASIAVYFYVDGAVSQGTFAGGVIADQPWPDVNNATGRPGNHGFRWPVPTQFWDGKPHKLWAYRLDTSGRSATLLGGSPRDFQLRRNASAPTGSLDAIENGVATGWALDPDSPEQPIIVQFYVDGPKGTGIDAGATRAALPQPRGNKTVAGHGFQWPVPTRFQDGKPHSLYAYGVDSSGNGSTTALNNSPKKFVVLPPQTDPVEMPPSGGKTPGTPGL